MKNEEKTSVEVIEDINIKVNELLKEHKEFERNIYSLQLLLWDIETELDEYTKENLESFKNESLNYLEEWSKEDK